MPKKNKAERWRELTERAHDRADGMRDDASKRSMLGIAMGMWPRCAGLTGWQRASNRQKRTRSRMDASVHAGENLAL
jgi:hypothetical protein